MKIQYKEVSTFILKKLSIFLEDNKLLFIPKQNSEIIQSIQALPRSLYFNVQEIGYFEKIVEQLKPYD
jgi:hypothetical protein